LQCVIGGSAELRQGIESTNDPDELVKYAGGKGYNFSVATGAFLDGRWQSVGFLLFATGFNLPGIPLHAQLDRTSLPRDQAASACRDPICQARGHLSAFRLAFGCCVPMHPTANLVVQRSADCAGSNLSG